MSRRRETRAYTQARNRFFNQGKQENAPCWLCGQPIDYNAKPGTSPDSHNLDHYYPVSTHPELQHDPANFRHAHMECNIRRGNGLARKNLGKQIPQWW